jgi:hypothetical protein
MCLWVYEAPTLFLGKKILVKELGTDEELR